MGERDAAAEECRDSLKRIAGQDSSNVRKILAYLTGDLSEEAFVALAEGNETKRRLLHFFQGQKAHLAGRGEEAADHFGKAAAGEGTSVDDLILLARAELDAERRRQKGVAVEKLEAAARALPPFEAIYDLDFGEKNPDDQEYRSFTWSVDMARAEILLRIDGRDVTAARDTAMIAHLKDFHIDMWAIGVDGGDTSVTLDLTFVKDLYRFGGEVRRLIPADPGTPEPEGAPTPTVGMFLEGKPGKDEQGTLRFFAGLGSHPLSWLKEALEAEEAMPRSEGDALVFEIPSKRKKITVDARTGLLRRLDAADYDGKARVIRLRSTRTLDRFPEPPARPVKLKPQAVDARRAQSDLFAQEEWLNSELAQAFEFWDRILKAGREEALQTALTRWAAQYSDRLHGSVVRILAGREIQPKLDLGTPAAELAKEAGTFAAGFSNHRKDAAEFVKRQLGELSLRTETALIESMVDSRLHGTIRATLEKAFDPGKVDRVRRDTYGDRLEELYREELAARTKL
jgi:hypothetical protein